MIFGIGDEEIVADDLDAVALRRGLLGKTLPVVFVESVLDRNDREGVDPLLPERDHLVARLAAALRFRQLVAPLGEEGAGGGIERDGDVLAGLVAGGLDRLHDQFAGLFVALEIGRKAALVADRRRVALALEELRQRVEGFGPVAQGLGEVRRADRHRP